jgi:hypothetical protein
VKELSIRVHEDPHERSERPEEFEEYVNKFEKIAIAFEWFEV